MNPTELMVKKQQERETLRNVVAQWNANRLDLFELSEPNEDLEFHGVMRFYFQDSGQKVATKCIRVASDATSQAVIETLIEKFRPDMRMLSVPEYALYEIHENGDERRLGMDEKPLLVQLNWHIDDREGRFLLRRIDDVTNMPSVSFQEGGSSFRRKLSKREKKQLKKQEKLNKLKTTTVPDENDAGVAEKLYTELPETSFTRSISNPEAVMRRRRQQKLERKLQQFRSKDGGPDTGGTLKIYGEALCRDVPYKTLLLSVRDTAQQVVKEMLAKYGLEKEQDPHNFCLVQVNTAVPVENGESKEYHGGTNNREYILDDDECPLAILMNHPSSRGSIMFHVRRRPADYHPRKRKKKLQGKWSKGSDLQEYRYEDSTGYNNLPFFLELNPDGSDILNGAPKRHRLHPNVTEVGSERPNNQSQVMQQNQSQSLQLFGPNVQPRHCVIGHTAGIVTVTPCSREAETYVNNQRIYETTILQNGAIVKFGRIHVFRFLDPNHDPDRTRQRHDSARQNLDFSYDRQSTRGDNEPSGQQPSPNASTQNYETTFDVDGNVETVSTSSLKEETRSQRSVSSSNGNRLSNYERYPRGTDPILPAVLEFREETEEAFLHAIITDLDPSSPSFKLAPAYCLYLVARYRASTHYRPELTPTERAHRLTGLLARVAAIIHNVIQERYTDAKLLAFWMANSSELLHFLKCDRHISAFSLDAQDILAECVEISFRNLVSCLQGDLAAVMPHFMAKEDQTEEQQDSTGSVLQVLTLAMALLRRCRVNAALTIQLFSQLFHFINMWSFNKVVASSSPNTCYCTRAWGLRLKTKLAQLEVWAERQGLELAADCHLARIIQAAHLLQAPKYSPEDLATLSSTCFKLNSLQLRALLTKYQPTPEEPRLPHELIENVVRVAENVADELARSDGREIRLEEETELQLPFLLPEDGYSCDVVRGIPQGLSEFLAPLQHAGLCRMSAQPTSSGLWTIYMHQPQNPGARSPSAMSNRSGGFPPGHLQEPELQVIRLNKSNNGMGLSIVAAKGAGQDRLGIYIKSVVKGGAADADGQLQAGDQLLKVDGQSLVGITQERAAEYLVRTGPTVTLEVAKQGAIYHGLATLLQQPSPVMARGPRRMSERDLPSRVLSEQNHNGDPRRSLNTHAPIQSSKSVPALNSGNNDLVHGGPVSSTPATHPSAKHEVFNPGYSRTSSTNSIPQQSQAQQGLRSKSSQNLSDPRSPNPQLPPTGLGSRQSSNPSLHHPHLPPHPQSSQHAGHSGGQVGSGQQSNGEGERFYQNLSIYRNQEIHNGYPPPSPNRGKLPSPQQAHDDRSPATAQVKGLRGSQSSLHNPTSAPSLRPASAYLPPSNPSGGYNGPQQMAARSQSSRDIGQESPQGYSPQQVASRSQSSRDIMRQEAKLHEMQEEVRRREMRGVVSPQQYSVQPGPPHTRPQMAAHLQQRVPNTTYPYPQESNHPYPGPSPQYNGGQRPPSSYAPPTAPKPVRHPSEPALNRPPNMYEQYRPHPHPEQQYRPQTGPLLLAQGEQYRPHPGPQGENRVGFSPQYVGDGPSRPQYAADSPSRPQYTTDSPNRPPYATEGPNRPQYAMDGQNRPQYATDSPGRPQMPHEEAGYRDSPPPPPPPTTTHPLYQQKAATSTGQQADARYTASSGDAPRGGFYPASPSSGGPPRHPFPFNSVATNPWDREEREKDQQRRREAARAWRDQQINELSSLAQRTPQQEEQLRALRLEREFQRRAEEAAKLEEEEEAEEEQESVERVQGLLRMATATQNTPPKHPQPPRPPPTEDKERIRREQEMKREQEANKRREEENRQQQLQQQQQQMLQQQQQMLQQQQQQQQQQQMLQQQQQQQHQLKENFMASPTQPTTSQSSAPTRPPTNININKATNPSHLRLDNLVINGPSSPTAQYNGYNGSYQTTHGEGILKSPPQSPTESGTARLDTLLGTPQPPAPPERGSSFAITQAVTQGVLRNAGRESSGIGTATVKRVSFSDPNANNTSSSQPMERIREDPNHFINEAETLLASPKSPDGGPFGSNTPGVIGSQEVYKDPRARLLAAQQKLQTTRSGPLPEKLSFKEKMKMFAMETGEDGTPRDKVKISRAQRDIDNLGSTPTSPLSPSNNNNQ